MEQHFRFHALSETGCVRADNQDRVLADPALGLFIVADGMGGHRHGELAAELAVATLRQYVASSANGTEVTWPFGYSFKLSLDGNRLATGIRLANRQVWKHAEEAPQYAGMGTTIAAVILRENLATAANVGDSRIYLYRTGKLALLSVDDTWLNVALEQGRVTIDKIKGNPLSSLLTQAAGTEGDLDVHVSEVELQSGDWLLLCSDGLYGVVPEEAMVIELERAGGPEEAVLRLTEAARVAGAPDNVSCVLVRPEI